MTTLSTAKANIDCFCSKENIKVKERENYNSFEFLFLLLLVEPKEIAMLIAIQTWNLVQLLSTQNKPRNIIHIKSSSISRFLQFLSLFIFQPMNIDFTCVK